jgi:hypothetical protein
MTEQDREQKHFRGSERDSEQRGSEQGSERGSENDDLDLALDAALLKYAVAEPRTGLEERILANLRVERSRVPYQGWRPWALAATAIVVVVIALAWRLGRQQVIAHRPAVTTQTRPETQVASRNGEEARPQGKATKHRTAAHKFSPKTDLATTDVATTVVSTNPKLDQFPSPEPLSEQELALAQYVRNFPTDANLAAQAQEASEREVLAKMQALANESGESN